MTSGRVWTSIAGMLAVSALAAAQNAPARPAKVDLKAAEAAMIKADEAFNQSVADKDMTRFLALIADLSLIHI